MRSSKFLGIAALVTLTGAWSATIGQTDWSKIEIDITPLSGSVHMLVGAGGNMGISAGGDGIFVIDDQYAPLSERVQAALDEMPFGEILFVLNTHWHADHTGGNEALGKAGAVVVAHDNVRKRMSGEQFNSLWERTTPASPAGALPIVTFSRDMTFWLNDDEIHVFHVDAAHTDGDAIIHFRKADVVHMGDVWFNGMYPFIDFDSGGSIDGMIAAVEQVLAFVGSETRIIPGHGDLGGRDGLVDYLDMLKSARSAVAKLVRAGNSLEEIQAQKPTAGLDERWGGGFIEPDVFVRILYEGLADRN
jgi:cyclase